MEIEMEIEVLLVVGRRRNGATSVDSKGRDSREEWEDL